MATRSALPDLWPMAREAGWPGLLIDEDHGGAGLDAFDAMLVLGECGRVLAPIPLLGHLPATAILGAAPNASSLLEALATGERRAAYLPVSTAVRRGRALERRSGRRQRPGAGADRRRRGHRGSRQRGAPLGAGTRPARMCSSASR